MGNLRQLQQGRWSGVFAGRAVTISEVASVWLLYIDHVLQEGLRFRSAEAAYQWACLALGASRELDGHLRAGPGVARLSLVPVPERASKSTARRLPA